MNEPNVIDSLVLEVTGRVDAAARGLPGWLDALAGVAAAAVVALGAVTLASAEAADEAIKNARGVGLQVEEYTALVYAADLAGASTSTLRTAVRALSMAIDAAGKGTADYVDALDAVGLAYEDATAPGVTFADLLPQILDGLNDIQDPLRRTIVAQRLLGRGAQDMASLVAEGGDAFRQATEEAQRYGVVIGTDAAEASEALNDNIARMRLRIGGLVRSFGLDLVPSANRVVEAILDVMDAFQPDAMLFFDRVASGVARTVDFLVTPLGRLTVALGAGGLLGVTLRNVDAIADLLTKIPVIGPTSAATARAMAAGAITAAPWLALLLAVGLALDDVRAYMEGAPSYTGDMAKALGIDSELYAALASIRDLLYAVYDAEVAIAEVTFGDAEAALRSLGRAIASIVPGLSLALDVLDALGATGVQQLLDRFTTGTNALTEIATTSAARVRGGTRPTADEFAARVFARTQAQQAVRSDPVRVINVNGTTINVPPASDPYAVAREVRAELERQAAEASAQLAGG